LAYFASALPKNSSPPHSAEPLALAWQSSGRYAYSSNSSVSPPTSGKEKNSKPLFTSYLVAFGPTLVRYSGSFFSRVKKLNYLATIFMFINENKSSLLHHSLYSNFM